MPQRGTRPTTDRVREALFNVLAARLEFDGLAVLDLFAGSGALGLEALSRGAQRALFVDSDARAAAIITENARTLGFPGATVRRGAVDAVVTAGTSLPVDLVFADPPYELANSAVESVLAALTDHGWVTEGTIAVIERPAAAAALDWPAGWERLRERRYGDTRVELACYGRHP